METARTHTYTPPIERENTVNKMFATTTVWFYPLSLLVCSIFSFSIWFKGEATANSNSSEKKYDFLFILIIAKQNYLCTKLCLCVRVFVVLKTFCRLPLCCWSRYIFFWWRFCLRWNLLYNAIFFALDMLRIGLFWYDIRTTTISRLLRKCCQYRFFRTKFLCEQIFPIIVDFCCFYWFAYSTTNVGIFPLGVASFVVAVIFWMCVCVFRHGKILFFFVLI